MTRIDLPTPRVVGIDPSLTATGIATEADHWTAPEPRFTGDHRLHDLWLQVNMAVTGDGPCLAVIEDLPTHAHGAGKTGMAHGIVRHCLLDNHVPYVVVTPATLKKYATGKGNATKADMRMALYQRTGADVRDDNQVDAIWLRHLGLHLIGAPEIDLPKTHLAALAKVRDPKEAP